MCSESPPTVTGNGETETGRQGESEYQGIRRSGNHDKSVGQDCFVVRQEVWRTPRNDVFRQPRQRRGRIKYKKNGCRWLTYGEISLILMNEKKT